MQRHSLDSNNSIAKFTKVRPEDPVSRYAVGRLEMFGCKHANIIWKHDANEGHVNRLPTEGHQNFWCLLRLGACETLRNSAKPRHSEITVGLPRRFALCVCSMRCPLGLIRWSHASSPQFWHTYFWKHAIIHDLCKWPACVWMSLHMVYDNGPSLSLSLPNSILMVSHDSIVISCNISITIQLLHPS